MVRLLPSPSRDQGNGTRERQQKTLVGLRESFLTAAPGLKARPGGGGRGGKEGLPGGGEEGPRRFGASPPMRITASWSGSSGSAEYKYVARWSAPCGEFPLGRCALNQSQAAVNEDERLGRIRPYRSGLDTSMPHTSFCQITEA